MTTATQFALLAGALIMLGLTLAVLHFVPAQPDLTDVVRRYSTSTPPRQAAAVHATSLVERVGMWGIAHLPSSWWGSTPTQALALLQIPLHRHYGKKIVYGLVGLALPPLLGYFLAVLGWPIPFVLPAVAAVAVAAFLFMSPDLDVRTDAKRARTEFSRALSAYTDLVALERAAGSGARQAMELAAGIGESWVFRRLGEELARSRWSGVAPWDALHDLSDELGLPELDDLADIMRLSQEGSQVYSNLRARSSALRTAMMTDELAKANAASERMTTPISLMGVVFLAILIVPSLLRVMMGG